MLNQWERKGTDWLFGEVSAKTDVLEGEVEEQIREKFGSDVEFVNVSEEDEFCIGIDEWLGKLVSTKGALFKLLQWKGNCYVGSDEEVEELGMEVSDLYGKICS